MGFFDKLKKQAANVAEQVTKATGAQPAQTTGGGGAKSIAFAALPASQAEFKALPQAQMQTPHDTAAMFVLALNVYSQNPNEALAMMNILKGPSPLSGREIQFLKGEMGQAGKGDYLARSYFAGATPQNDYTPSRPYTVVVSDNPYSYDNQGYAKLFVACGGADTPRPITLRQAKDGKWYLWEQFLLTGIKKAESSNPWA
ncbi:MAG: hypothetical protein FWD23_06015 [Oscillospiraceae bacterium]|nr:hypothetical protein [Oscillospiraceae bacterium]